MKKTLSLILALILAFTAALPAFAADNGVRLGEAKRVTVRAGGTEDVVFTPSKDGFYSFSYALVLGNSDNVSSELNFNAIIDWNDDSDAGLEYHFVGKKDKPVTVTFDNPEGRLPYTVKVVFKELSVKTMNEGKNSIRMSGYDSYFKFVPKKDGYYNFESECSENLAFEIIDANMTDEFNDDNGYDGNYNFDCTVSLKEDETYLIGVYAITEEPKDLDCTVTVTYDKAKKVRKIDFRGETLMQNGVSEWIDVYLAPTGAVPTADVKVTSSNEEIFTIEEYDKEYSELKITSHKPGVAFVTVNADGTTGVFMVKVCSDTEYFFINLYREIKLFFRSVQAFFNRFA